LVCGVSGIGEETLQNAAQVALEYITRFCGGEDKIVSTGERKYVDGYVALREHL